ncbi:tetratricopeptide repeat protein [Actinomadura sp. HBU206391]|nr:tetratricopeptide repeat protein [Actinomadura sp. HBU206391]
MSQERLSELKAAVAAGERELGTEHPGTLDARVRLALGYRESERDEEALLEPEEVVAVRDRALGPDHPDTLDVRHELALTYFHVGTPRTRCRSSSRPPPTTNACWVRAIPARYARRSGSPPGTSRAATTSREPSPWASASSATTSAPCSAPITTTCAACERY